MIIRLLLNVKCKNKLFSRESQLVLLMNLFDFVLRIA